MLLIVANLYYNYCEGMKTQIVNLLVVVFVFSLFLFLPKKAFAALTVSFASGSSVLTASGFVGDTGNTVYVSGGSGNRTYTIYWDATATGKTVSLGTCSTGVLGTTCNTPITIPHSSKGNWLIHANQGSTNSNTLTFTLNPKLTASSPASGTIGTSVTVSGTGFASESVAAKLGTYTLGSATPTSGAGGTFGDFSVTAGAPAMPQGSKAVNASGTLSGNVSSALTYIMNPKIAISSSSGFPGQSTNVNGDGFAASSTITITQNGSNTSTTNTTNADGSFGSTAYYPTGSSGVQTINAHDAIPNTATNVNYTLNAGTLSISTPSSASLSSVTLSSSVVNGTGSLGTITVTDQRGTLVGWSLTATSTNFVSGGNSILVTNFNIVPGSVTLVQGPANDATAGSSHTFTSTSDATTLMSATSTHGSGIFSVTPSLTLSVPVGSYAGSYTATITETVQ